MIITINKEKKAAAEKEKLKKEALAYLNSTDWYVARKQETGKEIPQDVLDKRAEARVTLSA